MNIPRPFIAIDPADVETLVRELGAARGSSALLIWLKLNALAFRASGPVVETKLDTLQLETGLARATATECLKDLNQLGFIATARQYDSQGHRATNQYTLLRGLYSLGSKNEPSIGQSSKNELGLSSKIVTKNELLLQEETRIPPMSPKQGKRFIPPTVDEVAAYCQERQNNVDPDRFVDHYSAVAWRVGRNPMKDWQAAVRTWERRAGEERTGQQQRTLKGLVL